MNVNAGDIVLVVAGVPALASIVYDLYLIGRQKRDHADGDHRMCGKWCPYQGSDHRVTPDERWRKAWTGK